MSEPHVQERPHIVWTLRRTGGTALTNLLAKVSQYETMQHEPFNPDRIHGSIVETWKRTQDIDGMRREISVILQKKENIKHCFELVPMQLNCILMHEASVNGYHHVYLGRKSEVDRLFSLEVAQITDAWGADKARAAFAAFKSDSKEVRKLNIARSVAHMTEANLRSRWLTGELKRPNVRSTRVNFEDIFCKGPEGVEAFRSLLLTMGHSEEKLMSMVAFKNARRTIEAGGQNSKQVEDSFSNARKWRRTMIKNWRLLQGDYGRKTEA